MTKSKILTAFILPLCLIFTGLLFSACNDEDAKVTGIVISDYVKGVEIDAEYDYSTIVVKAIMSDNTEIVLSHDDFLTFSNIDTTTSGRKDLVATFVAGEETFSDTKIVTVYEDYTVLGFSQSENYSDYLENSNKQNTYNYTGSNGIKGFVDINNPYLVGYQNAFIYTPLLQVFANGEVATLTEFNADIDVFLIENNSQTKLNLQNNSYVSVDTYTHYFTFTSSAENKQFMIEMYPSNIAPNPAISKVSATIQVVDGFNVYSAKELAVIDNVNAGGKWTEFKQQNNLTNITTNKIILHNDITITSQDVPSIHFWTSQEVGNASDSDIVVGSLKDDDMGYDNVVADAPNASLNSGQVLGSIYRRVLYDGESFTIEGNYFQLSAQSIPLIVREVGDSVATPGEPIVSHTSLIGVEYNLVNELGNNATLNINNIALFGNSNKADEFQYSGGVMFLKSRNIKVNLYNNLSQSWYMSYMFRGANYNDVPYDENEGTMVSLNKVNAFDAYNTLLYLQGVGDIELTDCTMIGAGGPVMIADHTKNKGADAETGRPCNIITTNCKLESLVAGSEGWFVSMNATGTASLIKGIDNIIRSFTQQAVTLGLGTQKTFVINDKMNLIVVFKSDNTSGMEDEKTLSSFRDTAYDYAMILNRYSDLIASNEMANVLETFNGARFIPTDTDPYYALYGYEDKSYPAMFYSEGTFAEFLSYLSNARDYLAGYLFNNMGILLGLTDAQ